MKLTPFVAVDGTPFTTGRKALVALKGPPRSCTRNAVGLDELDYGDGVYRFQDSGRLEEVTRRAPVLHLGGVAIPFRALKAFVRDQDPAAFERAGYLVSPTFGLAFVPDTPDWVTALAAHCIDSWRALPRGPGTPP